MHQTVWAKVNAPVDEGIAEVVELLSQIPGLQTLSSCQGDPSSQSDPRGRSAHVFFYFGEGWLDLAKLLFDQLLPVLGPIQDNGAITLDVFTECQPRGHITFCAEATPLVAAALKDLLTTRRSSPCSRDTARTVPRS